jgi:hypothetical protein
LPADRIYTHITTLKKEFNWRDDNIQLPEETIRLDDIGKKQLNFVTKYRDYDIEIITISLIYNTEIFMKLLPPGDLSTIINT